MRVSGYLVHAHLTQQRLRGTSPETHENVAFQPVLAVANGGKLHASPRLTSKLCVGTGAASYGMQTSAVPRVAVVHGVG